MTKRQFWTDNVVNVDSANLNALAYGSGVNLLRNSNFETWGSAGGGSTPEGWNWTAGGAVLARNAAQNEAGDYCAYIDKSAGGTTARLEQYIIMDLPEGDYTVVARIKANTANKARCFLHDSTAHRYSDYHTGSGSYETLSVAYSVTGHTYLIVGVDVDDSTIDCYIASIALYRGGKGPDYMPAPQEFSTITPYWEINGVEHPVSGGLREIPFKATGVVSGTDPEHTFTYTVGMGAGEILVAHGDVQNMGTTSEPEVDVRCYAYTTTGFTIALRRNSGNLTNGEAYDVRGVFYALGWDTYTEVFKGS